jgi:hypothetical protein
MLKTVPQFCTHLCTVSVLPSTVKYPAPHFHPTFALFHHSPPLTTTPFTLLPQTSSTTSVPDSTYSTYRPLGVIYNILHPRDFLRRQNSALVACTFISAGGVGGEVHTSPLRSLLLLLLVLLLLPPPPPSPTTPILPILVPVPSLSSLALNALLTLIPLLRLLTLLLP